MTQFKPKDANFEARVRTSFARQTAMATLNIEIAALNAGEVELKCHIRPRMRNNMVLFTPALSPPHLIQPADMFPSR